MNKKSNKIFIVGVGMTKFEKPGKRKNFDYPEMAKEAVFKALQDAKVSYESIQQAYVGYCYGDSTCGQKALYEVGLTGIPIINVNNNCSTGSTALMMAVNSIKGGLAHCVLALGFEKMDKGSIGMNFQDRVNPLENFVGVMSECCGLTGAPITCQLFGNAGMEHIKRYGTKPEHFAKIAFKNRRNSVNNPNSQFQERMTMEEILKSTPIHGVLTKLQCCPTSDGGACAVVCSEEFVRKHQLEGQAVEVIGQSMATDLPSTFQEKNPIKIVGYDMTVKATKEALQEAGIKIEDVDVIELHDCFSSNELITYEALGLCPQGKAGDFIERGDNDYGGKFVVNPSGGLISKGHPLGATGLAQCAELCWQLRQKAGKRQVKDAKIGLQHNLGLGGACVVTIYRLGFPQTDNRNKNNDKPQSLSQKAPLSSFPSSSSSSTSNSDPSSKIIFDEIEKELKEKGKELVKKINGVYCFKVTNSEGRIDNYIIDVKNGGGSVTLDPNGKGDVTMTIKDENLYKIMIGTLNPQQAYFKGLLKINGNMGLAMKFQQLIPKKLKSKL